MKYVLDASVALKWVLTEADSAKALDLRDQFRKNVHELLAPDIFLSEVAHSLTRAERKGILKQGEAAVLLADVLSTPPDFHPVRPLVPRAVDVSSQMRIGYYDCLYVALAEREYCRMVAADDKLIKNLQPRFLSSSRWRHFRNRLGEVVTSPAASTPSALAPPDASLRGHTPPACRPGGASACS